MSRMSSISNVLATWVSVFAAITGGYLGLDSYMEDTRKRVDERQLAAFEQVQHFLSRDLVPIREKVRAFAAARWQCDSQPYQSFGLSETELATYVETFDLAEACLTAGLCDRSSIERFFAPYARFAWPVLKDYVGSVREASKALALDTPFGAGLERLAGDGAATPTCGG